MAVGFLVHQLVMDIAKMETTMVPATMMVVTVVEIVLILNNAQSVNVSSIIAIAIRNQVSICTTVTTIIVAFSIVVSILAIAITN